MNHITLLDLKENQHRAAWKPLVKLMLTNNGRVLGLQGTKYEGLLGEITAYFMEEPEEKKRTRNLLVNVAFTHPEGAGARGTEKEQIVPVEQLGFFKGDHSIPKTFYGQSVCDSCYMPIVKVEQTQQDDIEWHWDEEGKRYFKISKGDSEKKKCGHCGNRLEDEDDMSFPY